ncbi:hypothetical protein AAY473_004707 [Plecturocebus cupreus]
MGSCYVAQTGLELLGSSVPPALASQSTGITGMSHCDRPGQLSSDSNFQAQDYPACQLQLAIFLTSGTGQGPHVPETHIVPIAVRFHFSQAEGNTTDLASIRAKDGTASTNTHLTLPHVGFVSQHICRTKVVRVASQVIGKMDAVQSPFLPCFMDEQSQRGPLEVILLPRQACRSFPGHRSVYPEASQCPPGTLVNRKADVAEIGFCHAAQAGRELLGSRDPPVLTSQSAGITGVSQCAWLSTSNILMRVCFRLFLHCCKEIPKIGTPVNRLSSAPARPGTRRSLPCQQLLCDSAPPLAFTTYAVLL